MRGGGGEGRGSGGKRGTRVKQETRHTGECEGRESPLGIYTLYSRNPSRISPRSLLALSAEVWRAKRAGRGRKERQHNAREDRETLSASSRTSPVSLRPSTYRERERETPSEATEILEASLCFWLLERVKIPPRKTLSECEGSLKMYRKRRTARII